MDSSNMTFMDLFVPEALDCLAAVFADATKDGTRISVTNFMSQMKFDANLPIERERERRADTAKGSQRSDEELSKFLLDRREEVILALISEGHLDNRIYSVSFAHYRGANGGIGRAESSSSDLKKKSGKRRITTEFVSKLTSVLNDKCIDGSFIKRAQVAELLGATASNASSVMLDISEALSSDPYLSITYGTLKGSTGGIGLQSIIESKQTKKSS